MITEAFVEAGDQRELDCHSRIDPGDHPVADQSGGELIELLVRLLEPEVGVARPLPVRRARHLPHMHRDVAHLLNETSAARRQDAPERPCGSLGDVFRQVGAALELGDDLQHRHQVLELLGRQGGG